jgi:hypothetical protein
MAPPKGCQIQVEQTPDVDLQAVGPSARAHPTPAGAGEIQLLGLQGGGEGGRGLILVDVGRFWDGDVYSPVAGLGLAGPGAP